MTGPRISRYTNLNGEPRLRISSISAANAVRDVRCSVDEAAALVRTLLSDPEVREAIGRDLEIYL